MARTCEYDSVTDMSPILSFASAFNQDLSKWDVSAVTGMARSYSGDTANNPQKPATLETGIEIQVPLFVKPGDKIKVDSRTKKYVSRV